MRKLLIAFTALTALSGGPGARAQANPVAEAAMMTEAAAMGAKCGWLTAFQHDAVLLSRREKLAVVEAAQGAAGLAAANAQVAAAKARAAAVPCDGEAAVRVKNQVLSIASSSLGLWVARAEAYLALSVREPWAQDITVLNRQQQAVNSAVQALSRAPQYAPLKAHAAKEAPIALAAICPSRKSLRFARGERPCPPISGGDMVARVLVEGAEKVAPLYAEQMAGSPPGASIFLATSTRRHAELATAKVTGGVTGGLVFEGRAFASEYERRAHIDDLLKKEFGCERPGQTIFDTRSPLARTERIGEPEGTEDNVMVRWRMTAPIRRAGQAEILSMATATTREHQDIMKRVMVKDQQEYRIESWDGPDLGGSLLNCP